MTQQEFQEKFGGEIKNGWLVYDGDLFCHNNQLTSLPERLKVGRDLSCSSNQLTSLPERLKVGGGLFCYDNPNLLSENIKIKVKNIAFYNRTLIPYELFEKLNTKQITSAEITQIKNSEHRMVALSVYGADKLLKEFNAQKIDNNE